MFIGLHQICGGNFKFESSQDNLGSFQILIKKLPYTGCKSQFRKIFGFKNWKEPMLVLKQTIPQQKALDLSFNLAP